jgi:very-short-patch-repair endonuclease
MYFLNSPKTKTRRRELRTNMPRAEVILWGYLKGKQMGHRFLRQYGVGQYSLDFYCPEARLAIELDGDSHFVEGAQEKDRLRDQFVLDFGIKTIRFPNDRIYDDLFNVLQEIASELKKTKIKTPPLI